MAGAAAVLPRGTQEKERMGALLATASLGNEVPQPGPEEQSPRRARGGPCSSVRAACAAPPL
eukprot:3586386-Pyramimonas_sp.AAC.1